MHVPLRIFSCIKVVPKRNYHNHNDQFTHWEYSMRERTMNLKMYSRALRVRRMGSQCSPRLDTSRYLFNTDISFLEENDMRERYLIYLNWIEEREKEKRREEKERGRRKQNPEERITRKRKKEIKIIQPELSFPSDALQVGKFITNSIFHFYRVERQSATDWQVKNEREEDCEGGGGGKMAK